MSDAAARIENPGSRVDLAYQFVRERILDNDWPPGFTLLEQELARQLSMSRTPVREALIRLQDEGLVQVVPRHGMRVLPVSPQDMMHIYQVLTSLEATAAQLAAKAVRGAASAQVEMDCRALDASTDQMEQALRDDDLESWARADERFHRALIELSGNPFLAQTVYQLWDRAHRARMVTLRLRSLPTRSTHDHRQVSEAIKQGDAALAARLHRDHRERGSREMMRILLQSQAHHF